MQEEPFPSRRDAGLNPPWPDWARTRKTQHLSTKPATSPTDDDATKNGGASETHAAPVKMESRAVKEGFLRICKTDGNSHSKLRMEDSGLRLPRCWQGWQKEGSGFNKFGMCQQ